MRHPLAATALALALPLAGFLTFPTLTAQFFPGTDRDQLYIQVKLADGRSIYDTSDYRSANRCQIAQPSI